MAAAVAASPGIRDCGVASAVVAAATVTAAAVERVVRATSDSGVAVDSSSGTATPVSRFRMMNTSSGGGATSACEAMNFVFTTV